MNNLWIYSVGFLAQMFFAARLMVQWIKSEQAGKVLSPTLFWQLSLMGSILMMGYGLLRLDMVIILGQLTSYLVYLRNLHYQRAWARFPGYLKWLALTLPFIASSFIWLTNGFEWHNLLYNPEVSTQLLIWGSIGQLLFTLRFVYQWYHLENLRKSVLPLGFWIISIVGSLMILCYAVLRSDPVLFLGQIFGTVIYARNILIDIKSSTIRQPH